MSTAFLFILVAFGLLQLTNAASGEQCVKKPDVNTLLKKSGESVSIYCSSENDAPVRFTKGDGDSPVKSGGNILIEGPAASTEKVLRITNVSHQDEGVYKCKVGQAAGACATRVKVYDEILFPNEDTEKIQYILQGRSGVINCTSRGNPNPENEFFVAGKKILDTDHGFVIEDGNLRIIAAENLNDSVINCRASLPDFSYFRDFNITLGVLNSEPLSCLQCRTFDVGNVGDSDECSTGSMANQRQECASSCVTINATGPLRDGSIKYGMVRGCGDQVSLLKATCITVPNDMLTLNALSVFGNATGLTKADICFCSSRDGCNNDVKTYSEPDMPQRIVIKPDPESIADPNTGVTTRASISVFLAFFARLLASV